MRLHTPTLHVCDECHWYDYNAKRCDNPRSLRFGNDADSDRVQCEHFASQAAARRAIPKPKRWTRVKSIYDAELPNARWV